MATKESKPTESELEILQILWEKGPSPVRAVNEELNKKREVGYTTTLKLMQIMTEKKLVVRDISSKRHIYKAAIEEKKVQQNLLSSFLEKTFRGSAMELVIQALGNHKASQEELEEIKAMIAKLENKEEND